MIISWFVVGISRRLLRAKLNRRPLREPAERPA